MKSKLVELLAGLSCGAEPTLTCTRDVAAIVSSSSSSRTEVNEKGWNELGRYERGGLGVFRRTSRLRREEEQRGEERKKKANDVTCCMASHQERDFGSVELLLLLGGGWARLAQV
jgi:hypothetical protein